jgi:hypothetical protein
MWFFSASAPHIKPELSRDDLDLLRFLLLPSLTISRTASRMLSQVVILERVDGIHCCLRIVDMLGPSVFSCYLCDLVTVIIPKQSPFGSEALTYTSDPTLDA